MMHRYVFLIVPILFVFGFGTEIAPKGYYGLTFVRVGDALNISCSLGNISGDLRFLSLKKILPGSMSWSLLQPDSMDNTTKYYQEESIYKKRTYTCSYNNSYHKFLEVDVGYLPSKPSSIRCVSLNRAQLECRWDIPEKELRNNLCSKWSINYTDGFITERSCPHPIQINETVHNNCNEKPLAGCRWLNPKKAEHGFDGFESANNYSLRLHLKNVLGETELNHYVFVDQIEIDIFLHARDGLHLAVVKLSLVVVIKEVQRRQAIILMKMPEDFYHNCDGDECKITYEIVIRSVWDNSRSIRFESKDREVKTTLHPLTPFTDYSVEVRSRAWNSKLTSDIAVKKFKTLAEAPGQAPKTVQGMFLMQSKPNLNETLLEVFFKPTRHRYWNSHFCNTTVTLEENGHVLWKENISSSLVTYTIPGHILADGPFDVIFNSYNDVGISASSSELFVSTNYYRENNRLSPSAVFVERNPFGYTVTWTAETEVRNGSFWTVMWWCKQGGKCKTDIDWTSYPAVTRSAEIRIQHNRNWNFAVTMVTNDGKSAGLITADCYFPTRGGGLLSPEFHLLANESTYLHIVLGDFCSFESRPIEYQVSFREHVSTSYPNKDFTEEAITEEASLSKRDIILQNLRPGVTYDVFVNVRLANNKTILMRNKATLPEKKHLAEETSTTTLVGIVIGIFLSSIVIVTVVWCCKQKICQTDTDIKIPDIEAYVNTGYVGGKECIIVDDIGPKQQVSVDSGHYSLPESISECPDDESKSDNSSGRGSTMNEDQDVFTFTERDSATEFQSHQDSVDSYMLGIFDSQQCQDEEFENNFTDSSNFNDYQPIVLSCAYDLKTGETAPPSESASSIGSDDDFSSQTVHGTCDTSHCSRCDDSLFSDYAKAAFVKECNRLVINSRESCEDQETNSFESFVDVQTLQSIESSGHKTYSLLYENQQMVNSNETFDDQRVPNSGEQFNQLMDNQNQSYHDHSEFDSSESLDDNVLLNFAENKCDVHASEVHDDQISDYG